MSLYKTINTNSEAVFRDRGSKFIAMAFPFQSEEQLKDILKHCMSAYPKATHYCYAYRIGMDNKQFRANDDGEPKGSAGLPILNQIDSAGLINVIIVVVRYYGGTKLGVSGLINAYKTAVKNAIESSEIVEKEVTLHYEIKCAYDQSHEVLKWLEKNRINVENKNFGEQCLFQISVKKSEVDSFEQLLARMHHINFLFNRLDT